MKRILLTALLVFGSTQAFADIMFDASVFYDSTTGPDGSDYTQKEGHLFIAMPVAVKEQLYLGPNFVVTSDQSSGGGTGTTEIGPRINYYFNQDKTYLLMLAWNPYVKVDNTSPEDSAWSYLAGVGYEMKINSNFYIGASIVYHALNQTNATTKVETKTSTTRPMINFSFRFK